MGGVLCGVQTTTTRAAELPSRVELPLRQSSSTITTVRSRSQSIFGHLAPVPSSARAHSIMNAHRYGPAGWLVHHIIDGLMPELAEGCLIRLVVLCALKSAANIAI